MLTIPPSGTIPSRTSPLKDSSQEMYFSIPSGKYLIQQHNSAIEYIVDFEYTLAETDGTDNTSHLTKAKARTGKYYLANGNWWFLKYVFVDTTVAVPGLAAIPAHYEPSGKPVCISSGAENAMCILLDTMCEGAGGLSCENKVKNRESIVMLKKVPTRYLDLHTETWFGGYAPVLEFENIPFTYVNKVKTYVDLIKTLVVTYAETGNVYAKTADLFAVTMKCTKSFKIPLPQYNTCLDQRSDHIYINALLSALNLILRFNTLDNISKCFGDSANLKASIVKMDLKLKVKDSNIFKSDLASAGVIGKVG